MNSVRKSLSPEWLDSCDGCETRQVSAGTWGVEEGNNFVINAAVGGIQTLFIAESTMWNQPATDP